MKAFIQPLKDKAKDQKRPSALSFVLVCAINLINQKRNMKESLVIFRTRAEEKSDYFKAATAKHLTVSEYIRRAIAAYADVAA